MILPRGTRETPVSRSRGHRYNCALCTLAFGTRFLITKRVAIHQHYQAPMPSTATWCETDISHQTANQRASQRYYGKKADAHTMAWRCAAYARDLAIPKALHDVPLGAPGRHRRAAERRPSTFVTDAVHGLAGASVGHVTGASGGPSGRQGWWLGR